MKLLVTGANGQIGWELARRHGQGDLEVIALRHSDLDIQNFPQVVKALKANRPDFMVNAAAFTAVDHAELNHESAYASNRDGPLMLAQACMEQDVPLLHLSTDYVFDGKLKRAYKESDKPHPINVYGQSKLDGEVSVRSRWEKHLILRVNGVYGVYGANFLRSILRKAQEEPSVRVVKDQKTCPTPAVDIADVIIKMTEHMVESPTKKLWGTYHYCSPKITTWCDFAKDILKVARKYGDIKATRVLPITTEDSQRMAQRPHNSAMNCQKIKINFGIKQHVREATLDEIIKELLQ